MGLQNESLRPTQPTKDGQKLTSFNTRVNVWEYWHAMSDISKNTSSAKLKVLNFISTLTQIEKTWHKIFSEHLANIVKNIQRVM